MVKLSNVKKTLRWGLDAGNHVFVLRKSISMNVQIILGFSKYQNRNAKMKILQFSVQVYRTSKRLCAQNWIELLLFLWKSELKVNFNWRQKIF